MVTGIVIKGWLYDHEKIRRICCLGEGIQAGQHNGIHNKVANSNNLYVWFVFAYRFGSGRTNNNIAIRFYYSINVPIGFIFS